MDIIQITSICSISQSVTNTFWRKVVFNNNDQKKKKNKDQSININQSGALVRISTLGLKSLIPDEPFTSGWPGARNDLSFPTGKMYNAYPIVPPRIVDIDGNEIANAGKINMCLYIRNDSIRYYTEELFSC